MMTIRNLCVALSVLTLICSYSASAQDVNRQLELARRYVQDGDYPRAMQLYEELYRQAPATKEITDDLLRIYTRLGLTLKRHNLVKDVHSLDSASIDNMILLGDSFSKLKQHDQAAYYFEKAIRLNPSDISTYEKVSSRMIENRDFAKAKQVYLRARKKLRNEMLFKIELANLYLNTGDYFEASREFLSLYYQQRRNLNVLKNYLNNIPDDLKSQTKVIDALEEAVGQNPDDMGLIEYLRDIYFQNMEYRSALDLTLRLDKLRSLKGVAILNFASQAFENGAFQLSYDAYAEFKNLYETIPQAEIGIARCLEYLEPGDKSETAVANDRVNEFQFRDDALAAYRKITRAYPGTIWQSEAFFRIGSRLLEKHEAVDEAAAEFRKITEGTIRSPFLADAHFKLSECYLLKGDLPAASGHLHKVLAFARNAETRDQAHFQLAEVSFFQADFTASRKHINQIVAREKGLFVNDALLYTLIFQDTEAEQDALKLHASVLLLKRQRKYSQSLAVAERILVEFPESGVVDYSLLEMGDLLARLQSFERAVSLYDAILLKKKGPFLDLAQKRKAEIYDEDLRDPYKAIEEYKKVLVVFPKSIYTEEVRKRIRKLELLRKKHL